MKRTTQLVMVFGMLLLLCCACPMSAFVLDFESGSDWEPVGWIVPGIRLATESGEDVVYADIDEGWPFASDNGKQGQNWEFYISGDVAVVSPFENAVVMGFTEPVSVFRVGYSSWFPFIVEAYDAQGALITSTSGGAHSRFWDGDGLSYLDISLASAGISSVRMRADQGSYSEAGWWTIDNVEFGKPQVGVPDWPTAWLALLGLPVAMKAVRLKARR